MATEHPVSMIDLWVEVVPLSGNPQKDKHTVEAGKTLGDTLMQLGFDIKDKDLALNGIAVPPGQILVAAVEARVTARKPTKPADPPTQKATVTERAQGS